MIKLAGLIIDSYDDPEFVNNPGLKAAGVPSADAAADLKDRDFAILIKTASGTHRKFPLASPALVKISAAYFNEYGHQLPADMRKAAQFRIQEAANAAGITVSGDAAESASDPGTYTFVVTGEPVDLRVGLSKQATVERAHEEWLANYGRMTPPERAITAHQLHKVASITDSRIMNYVPKDDYGPHFERGMKQRDTLLRDDHIKHAQFLDLKAKLPDMDAKRGAVLLYQLDKMAGIEDRVLDAFLTCWSGPVKVASCSAVDIKQNKVADLAVNHTRQVRQVFSEPVASAFLRSPVQYYLYTASPAVKNLIDSLISKLGTTSDEEIQPREKGGIASCDERPYVHSAFQRWS